VFSAVQLIQFWVSVGGEGGRVQDFFVLY
jgi:hypothetical protein